MLKGSDIMARSKRTTATSRRGQQVERLKEKLPEYLFNSETLAYPKVSRPRIAEAMGAKSITTVDRLLKNLKFDREHNKSNEHLTNEEVGEYLVKHLTVEQAYGLYYWAQENRFDKKAKQAKKSGKQVKRAYGLEGEKITRQRKTPEKTKADQKAEIELAKKTVANAKLGGQTEQQLNHHAPVDDTNAQIKRALQSHDVTNEQLINVAMSVFTHDSIPEDSTIRAYKQKLIKDPHINEYQWAIDYLYKHFLTNGNAQSTFYKFASEDKNPTGQDNLGVNVTTLLNFYEVGKSHINIKKVGDSVGY